AARMNAPATGLAPTFGPGSRCSRHDQSHQKPPPTPYSLISTLAGYADLQTSTLYWILTLVRPPCPPCLPGWLQASLGRRIDKAMHSCSRQKIIGSAPIGECSDPAKPSSYRRMRRFEFVSAFMLGKEQIANHRDVRDGRLGANHEGSARQMRLEDRQEVIDAPAEKPENDLIRRRGERPLESIGRHVARQLVIVPE